MKAFLFFSLIANFLTGCGNVTNKMNKTLDEVYTGTVNFKL